MPNSIISLIAAKQTVINMAINEVNLFSIKYWYSDILLKNVNIYSVDKTFRVFNIMYFNRTEYNTIFLYASSG